MRAALIAALLAAPAAASSPKDLAGAWLGRMGCTDGAYRMTLRLTPKEPGWAVDYSVRALFGRRAAVGGTGTLSPEGDLALSKPIPSPLLPETLPGVLEFKEGSPRFTGRTDLGALERLAGGRAACALEKKGQRLVCEADWRLLEQLGRCRVRLLRRGADKGPLPCPAKTVPAAGGEYCDPA